MKKVLLSIAIVAAGLFVASCGNNSGEGKAAFATDTLTFNKYKWYTWTVIAPKDKGYKIVEEKPENLKDVAGNNLAYLVGDKVVIAICDFDSKSLEEWKGLIQKNGLEKEKQGLEDTKIAGRNAFRYPSLIGDSELKKFGYIYYVDFKDFSEAGYGGYNNFNMSIYSADGQPDKIDEVLKDEEVQFILDNMTVTPKNE